MFFSKLVELYGWIVLPLTEHQQNFLITDIDKIPDKNDLGMSKHLD